MFDSKKGSEAGKMSKRGKDSQLSEIRSKFSDILDSNIDNINKWIDELAVDDPAKAIELLLKMS